MNLNRSGSRSHSVCRLFTVVLLGLFLIFLLVMLLFSAQAYRTAIKGTQQNNNLYTASSYISVKFHQHDSSQSIFTDTVDGSPALCMTDTVNDQQYITYIYLKEQHLKELFTASGNTPSAQMGTNIASLSDFQIQQEADGFYRITLKDPDGNTSSLLLHSGFGNNSF